MNTIYLIHKNFISASEMLNKIQLISTKIKGNFINDEKPAIVRENPDNLEQIEFGGLNESYFLESLQGKNFIENYGCVLTIDYDSDDVILQDFLKELFNDYPNLLVYNDEGLPKGNNYYTYNKSQFDKFNGSSLYAFLTNPPKDFGNMA